MTNKCPDCGGTHVRCMRCGSTFETVGGVQRVLAILADARAPLYGTTLADLSGYSMPGMYNLLNRLIAQGKVEKVGTGKQRKGYRLVTVIQFPQRIPLEQAA